jgi:hypothetical protein
MSEGMFNVEGYEEGDDDEVQSTKSGQSVSDYEGDMKQLPPTMYFGDELCRAQFLMTATGDVVHVCGKQLEQCRRPGHRVLRDSGSRGTMGYYDTIRVKTTIDGNAATFMTAAELTVKLASQRASNLAAVETLFGSTVESEVSPSATAGSWTMASGDEGPVTRSSLAARGPVTTMFGTLEVEPDQPTPLLPEIRTIYREQPIGHPRVPIRLTSVGPPAPLFPGVIPDGVEAAAAALSLERATTRAKIAELTERLFALNVNVPPPPIHPGPLRAVGAVLPSPHPPIPPVPQPAVAPPRFFAAFGLNGCSVVYTNFQMAVSMVGVDSSIVEYGDMDQAMASVLKWRHHQAAVTARLQAPPPTTPWSPPITPPVEGIGELNRPVASGTSVTAPELPHSTVPGPGDKGFFPSSKLMGPDPDKESDKFYGVEVGSERALRRAMAPADVDDEVAKDLAAAMVDAVSIPGTSSVTSGGDVDQQVTDLGLVGGAIQHLFEDAAQDRSGRERVRVDTAWQAASRNSIGSIKSADMLQPRFIELTGLRAKVMKSFHRRLRSIFLNAGWTESRAEAWAMSGPHAKIATGTYDAYVSLHLHLVGLATRGVPWGTLHTTIKYHVTKLGQIRQYAEGRLPALCEIYCYLRNNQAVNWYVAELQAERLLELQVATPTRSNLSNPEGANSRKVCPKCLSLVHTGGKAKCPWKDDSDKVAIAAAVKIMANAAVGLGIEK